MGDPVRHGNGRRDRGDAALGPARAEVTMDAMDDRRDRSDQDAADASLAEDLETINEFIAERQRRLLAEGREEGRKQGVGESLRQALIDMYAARIGTVPEPLR